MLKCLEGEFGYNGCCTVKVGGKMDHVHKCRPAEIKLTLLR